MPLITVLLFGGKLSVQHESNTMTMDEWLKCKVSAKTAVILKEIRALIEGVLKLKIEQKNSDVEELNAETTKIIEKLLPVQTDKPI